MRDIARAAGQGRAHRADVKVWGPTPAFYALLRGQTRERLLVQAARGVDVQALSESLAGAGESPRRRARAVDVDPVSFF